ncbi:MAG TPA: bacillithiol transferase BstA [Terracidiphilus sp.]|nr:bacillithiol transferase BstA [Terracidiphilus sp.]
MTDPMPDPITDPRYPIGRFSGQPAETPEARAAAIQTLRELPSRLRAAVDGLTGEQLETPYRDGGWTVRQTVHHVADSHANAYVRFKLALTEDWPTIKPYDEALWAKLADSRGPLEPSLALLTALHLRWVAVLESMSAADFARGFNNPAHGPQSLSTALAIYEWHSKHHTAHITALRARMGW